MADKDKDVAPAKEGKAEENIHERKEVPARSIKIGDKTYSLVPKGTIHFKVSSKSKLTDEEKAARATAEAAIEAQKGKINVLEYDVFTDSAIDAPAIRKKVITALGAKNTLRAVLLMNTNGFTGKANGNLKLQGKWTDKDGKEIVGVFNLYDYLKPIIQNGAIDMAADAVTTGRIVRVFSDISAAHFRASEEVGPFGLDGRNSYCWYFGGIYNCTNTFAQLMHFFGMAYALKNKRIPKALAIDFPASYLARSPTNMGLMFKFATLCEYVFEADSSLDTFEAYFKKMLELQGNEVDFMKSIKDPTTITYIMSLGDKWTQMLPVATRKKFKKELLGDAYSKSAFHSESIKKAVKEAKKAKNDETPAVTDNNA